MGTFNMSLCVSSKFISEKDRLFDYPLFVCLLILWLGGGAGTIYSRFEHSSVRDIALFIYHMLAQYKLLTINNLIVLHLSRNKRFLCVEKAR